MGFSIPSGRRRTRPLTAIQYSARRRWACWWVCGLISGSKTTWVIPSRSLRSIKITPPWSRRLNTQPIRVTSWPRWVVLNSPQWWVRFQSPKRSIFSMSFPLPCRWPKPLAPLATEDKGAGKTNRRFVFLRFGRHSLLWSSRFYILIVIAWRKQNEPVCLW